MKQSRTGNHGLFAWLQSVLTDVNAVQVATFVGLLWLLAYTFTGWGRAATLSVIWRLELWLADLLGITIRPSAGNPGANEPVAWAAILGTYCLISLWILGRAAHPIASEDDLLTTEEVHTTGWTVGRDT